MVQQAAYANRNALVNVGKEGMAYLIKRHQIAQERVEQGIMVIHWASKIQSALANVPRGNGEVVAQSQAPALEIVQ